jgi:hypothetical protein
MIAVPFPHLWIPRPRVPSWRDIASYVKLQRDPATGKINRKNGKLIRTTGSEACCCGSCANCTSSSFYTVTFADVDLCTGCQSLGSPNQSFQFTSSIFSGTFCLERDEPCVWRYTESPVTSITGLAYSGTGCPGVGVAFDRLTFFLDRDVTGGSLTVQLWFLTANVTIFDRSRSFAETDPCFPVDEWTNNLTACLIDSSHRRAGFNGTALVSTGC